jgi:putative ABC transport system permease protein
MFRLALRSILVQKTRFLLPLFGVVLGVAFVSGALLYGDSVRAAVDRVQAGTGVEVTGRALQPDLLDKVRAVPGVASATVLAEGRAFLVGEDGSLVGPPGAAAGVNHVAGRQSIVRGQAPANSGEVAIDEWSANRTGYQPGDQIRVVADGSVRTVRLAGVFTAADPDLALGGTMTVFDTDTAHALFGYTTITVTAAAGTPDSALARQIATVLPDNVRAAPVNREVTDNDKLTGILLGFAAVALFVAIFLVANTFTMLTAARAREHALLRAVGADRRYVVRSVLAEALLLGVAATVVGYLLGIAGAASMSRLFAVTDGPPIPLQVFGAGPMLAAFGVGIGVTVIAAYIPARRAAAVPPIAALRAGLPPTGKSLRRRNIVGAVMAVAGAALTFAAGDNEDLIYIGAPLFMLGLIILTPLFGMILTGLVRRPLVKVTGIRGTLAVENTRRNPRRTASTASALMIGLSICAAVTVPIASVSAQTERDADTGDTADIRLTPIDFASISPDVPARIAKLPGAQAVTPIIPQYINLNGDRYFDVAGVDPAVFRDFVPVTVRAGSLDRLAEGFAVTSEEAETRKWTVGSVVTGTFASGAAVARPVVAIYDAPDTFRYSAVVGTSVLPVSAAPETVLVKASPDQVAALQQEIKRTFDNPTLVVQTREEYREAVGAQFDIFLNILYALLSVSVLIGALAVVNTMTMSTLERIREIGLLRAVGLARDQVKSVLRLESVVIALLGAVIGLGAGCLIGVAVVMSQDGLPLAMPWARLGVFVVATGAIGVLASLWPARRAARIPILTAIQTDTE